MKASEVKPCRSDFRWNALYNRSLDDKVFNLIVYVDLVLLLTDLSIIVAHVKLYYCVVAYNATILG